MHCGVIKGLIVWVGRGGLPLLMANNFRGRGVKPLKVSVGDRSRGPI